MKTKFISLMVLFCIQNLNSALAVVIYRRASVDDSEKILQIYRNYTEDDRRRLVTFPEEVAEEFLLNDLNHKKIFIAVDSEDNEIIALAKLYVVDDSEVREIISDELKCEGPCVKQLSAERFNFVSDRDEFFGSRTALGPQADGSCFQLKPGRQVFVYYGGAYTIPFYRGQGQQTQLLQAALATLKSELISKLQSIPLKKKLILAYGQVDANRCNQGMIQTFTDYSAQLIACGDLPCPLKVSRFVYHHEYLTFKPTFVYDSIGHELKVASASEKGSGNLVIIHLKRK